MILAAGGGGLSVAFDMPTLMGRDSDDAALARRGRALRRGHRLGRRHGGALRRHPAGGGHHLDDDQRPGRPGVLHVPGRRRAPGRRLGRAQRHAADRHLQGVHRAEGVAVPARAAPAPDRRPDGALRERDPRVQAAVGLRLPHPRGRCDGRAGAGVHPRRRLRLRGAGPVARPGRRRLRARACRSSSTRTSTSSRRSRSSARPAGSGPAGCATSTARRPRRRSGCASTPRPPASR